MTPKSRYDAESHTTRAPIWSLIPAQVVEQRVEGLDFVGKLLVGRHIELLQIEC